MSKPTTQQYSSEQERSMYLMEMLKATQRQLEIVFEGPAPLESSYEIEAKALKAGRNKVLKAGRNAEEDQVLTMRTLVVLGVEPYDSENGNPSTTMNSQTPLPKAPEHG